jgi:mRNA interferase HigB
MKIVKKTTVRQWGEEFPDAASMLAAWLKVVEDAEWQNFAELRSTYRSADLVRAGPKKNKPVVVFNIRGNKYRLITAIHYDRQKLYAMMFLTHAEYDQEKWKDQL